MPLLEIGEPALRKFDRPVPSVLIRTAFSADHILSALTGRVGAGIPRHLCSTHQEFEEIKLNVSVSNRYVLIRIDIGHQSANL